MKSQTIIIMGPSGSGKGTQATLLKEHLEKKDPEMDLLYIQSGKQFREMAEKGGYTGGKVKATIEEGKLVPEFLTIWAWGSRLIEEFTGKEQLLFDGTPRRLQEAVTLHEALAFLGRKSALVIVLTVSKEVSKERLYKRGRSDDVDEEDVEHRLSWYDTEVVPVIDYFKGLSEYHVAEIDGERSIEEIQKDIVAAAEQKA